MVDSGQASSLPPLVDGRKKRMRKKQKKEKKGMGEGKEFLLLTHKSILLLLKNLC